MGCHICHQAIEEPDVRWPGEYPSRPDPISSIITVMYLPHQFDEECGIGREFNEVCLHRRCFNIWQHKDQLIRDWIASRKRSLFKKSKSWELLKEAEGFALARIEAGGIHQHPEVLFENYMQLELIKIPEEHWGILINMLDEINPEEASQYSRKHPLRSEGDCVNLYSEGSYIILLYNEDGINFPDIEMRLTQKTIFPKEQWPAAYEFILSSSECITPALQDPWTRIKVATVGSKIRESEEETLLMGALLYNEPALAKNEFGIDLFLEAVRMAALTLIVRQAEYYDGVARIRFIRLLENQIDERLQAIQDLALAAGKSNEAIDSFSSDVRSMWKNYAMRIIQTTFIFDIKGENLDVAKTLLQLASKNPNEAKEYSNVVLREIQALWQQYLSHGYNPKKE